MSVSCSLLSSQGCGRATAYHKTNKIVTLGGKTHVAWLDSISLGFRVRVRTLDHAGGEWSPTFTVGEEQVPRGKNLLLIDAGPVPMEELSQRLRELGYRLVDVVSDVVPIRFVRATGAVRYRTHVAPRCTSRRAGEPSASRSVGSGREARRLANRSSS